MKYSFDIITEVLPTESTKSTNENFEGAWRASLLDDRGLPVKAVASEDGEKVYNSFYLTQRFIESAFEGKRIEWNLLEPIDFTLLLEACKLDCEIIVKKKGNTYVALNDKGTVNLAGAGEAPIWGSSVAGTEYTHQETGIVPDWNKGVALDIPREEMLRIKDLIKAAREERLDAELNAEIRAIKRQKALQEV